MKKLRSKLWAKAIAVFLLAFLSMLTLAGGIACGLMYSEGYYQSSSYQKTQHCENVSTSYLQWMCTRAQSEGISVEALQAQFDQEIVNLQYEIYQTEDTNQVIVFRNTKQNLTEYETLLYSDFKGDDAESAIMYEAHYQVNDIKEGDAYWEGYQNYLRFAPYKWTIVYVSGITLLCSVLVFIFLLCSAGHRDETDELTLNAQDKLPLEIYTGMIGLFMFLLLVIAKDASYGNMYSFFLVLIPLGILAGLLLLAYILSLATRIKTHTLWTNTLCHQLFRACADFLHNLNVLWQIVCLFGAYLLALIFFYDIASTITVLFLLLLFFLLAASAIQLNQLLLASRHIAEGDLLYKSDTGHMIWKFKDLGDDLNHIRIGLSKAVDNQLKSERLKTELITNVSHDIKTPLTSIINYVDLLRKEELNNPQAVEYLDILDRQSRRLKKLTEDVVEASKASTGNIQVNLAKINVTELLNQSLGEYEETFAKSELTPVLNTPETPVYINADGRMLWRILDNLFVNVSKYAQVGTRVYLDVLEEGKEVKIQVRNISADPLNISSSELMERFVRGDIARSSEGSGLGLSIAESLAKLQGASFEIVIDGDLFKAILTFAEA